MVTRHSLFIHPLGFPSLLCDLRQFNLLLHVFTSFSGRRGDEESGGEEMETQSVASYSSTPGTHSGDEGRKGLSAVDT